MASTDIEICSNALVLLGDDPISSFDANQGKRATVAANLYANTRNATLRMHPWNCSRKRVSLPPTAVKPAYGWSYAFTLPADFMRVVLIGERPEEKVVYEIENGEILADVAECKLKYIYRNEVVSTWDALLTQAMIAHMAWAMAYPLVKSQALRDGMLAYMEKTLQMARTVNGQEKQSESMGDERLYDSRFQT